MSTELNKTTDPTAEKATLEQLIAQRTLSDVATDQGNTDTTLPDALGVVDPVKKEELIALFAERINNPRFWENENRITRLEAALVLPMYDDPSMRMFYDSAYDELFVAECKAARAEKRIPNEITEESICELAEQKHHMKYVLKPAKKAEKEAKKAAKKK
jgi:hypothetical protein